LRRDDTTQALFGSKLGISVVSKWTVDYPLGSTCFHRARYPYSLFGRECWSSCPYHGNQPYPACNLDYPSNFCWHPLAADVRIQLFAAQMSVLFILPSPQPAEANCLSKQSYIDAIQTSKPAVGYRIGVPTSLMLSLLEFLPHRHRRLRHC
jgi:hypothetical protein